MDSGEYRADIDGLRGLAVLAVVVYHSSSRLRGGFVGVDVFFVVSGYLITGIILRALERGTFSLGTFYARRARRILPALLLVLAATMVLGWWVLLVDEYRELGRQVLAGVAFASNLLLWQQSGYFDAAVYEKPLVHLWSLGVEEQFYLFWPFLILALWRLRGTRMGVHGWLALVMLASFALSVYETITHPIAAFYSPLSRAWELAAGAMLVTSARPGAQAPAASPRVRDVASCVGLLAIMVASVAWSSALPYPGWRALLPVLGTVMLVAAGPSAIVNRRLLSNRLIVSVGLISYPLYLWHWPLLTYARFTAPEGGWHLGTLLVVADIAALLLAYATFRFAEQRIRRQPLDRTTPRIAAVAAIVGAAAAGLVWANGVPQRVAFDRDPMVWSFANETPGCRERGLIPPGIVKTTWCFETTPGAKPRVIILGDSHARALWPAVRDDPSATGTLIVGTAGCPYLRGVRIWFAASPESRSDCPLALDRLYKSLGDSQVTIVLHARLAFDFARSGYGPREIILRNPRKVFVESVASPGADAVSALTAALSSDLRFLVGQGHHVVIILQVPEMGFDVRACARVRPIDFIFKRNIPMCSVPRRDVEARQALYRGAIGQVVREIGSSRITVLDPLNVLCDAERCYPVRDGLTLYQDSDHLSPVGARLVWGALQPLRAR